MNIRVHHTNTHKTEENSALKTTTVKERKKKRRNTHNDNKTKTRFQTDSNYKFTRKQATPFSAAVTASASLAHSTRSIKIGVCRSASA